MASSDTANNHTEEGNGKDPNYINVNYKQLSLNEMKSFVTSSGELELKFSLPEDDNYHRFMYRICEVCQSGGNSENGSECTDKGSTNSGSDNVATTDDKSQASTDDKGQYKPPDYTEYESCVYMERYDHDDSYLKVLTHFSKSGKFELSIFVRNSDKDGTPEEDKLFMSCALVRIDCLQARTKWKPFPCTARQEWGPATQDAKQLGLVAVTHTNGFISSNEIEDGCLEIKFEAHKTVKLIVELRNEKQRKCEMKNYTLHRVDGSDVAIYLKFTQKGYHVVDLYGKDLCKSPPVGSYPYICSYLVDVKSTATDQMPFPELLNQRSGATDDAVRVGLKPHSHKESFFKTAKGSIEVQLETNVPSNILTEMYHQTLKPNSGLIEDHIFVSYTKDNMITLNIRFQQSGLYLVTIYGKPKTSEGILACLFHYIIQVTLRNGRNFCMPFPKSYSLWNDGCTVGGLDEGYIPCEEVLPITIEVPDARHVAFIAAHQWSYLAQYNSDNSWSGNVNTGPAGSDLKLSACYDEDAKYFMPLLEFQVKTKKELALLQNLDQYENKYKYSKEQIKENEEKKKKQEEEVGYLQKELCSAMEDQKLQPLQKVIAEIDEKNCKHRFIEDYLQGRNILQSLERIERLSFAILNMNQPTMAEVRSYQSPPLTVQTVMVGLFLLLGENEENTKEWKTCQSLCNSNELNHRVKKFSIKNVHPEIASRAQQILEKYTFEEVKAISNGASIFYSWVLGMVEEVNLLKNNIVNNTSPATNIKRQKSIFNLSDM